MTRYARLSLIRHLNEGIYHLRFLLVFLSPNSAFYVSFIFRDFKAYLKGNDMCWQVQAQLVNSSKNNCCIVLNRWRFHEQAGPECSRNTTIKQRKQLFLTIKNKFLF